MNTLYRFYAKNGKLLYIGRTHHIESRFSSHRREKPWERVSRITLEHYDTADDLCRAEAAAIRDEAPLWNVQGGTTRRRGRAMRDDRCLLGKLSNRYWQAVDRQRRHDHDPEYEVGGAIGIHGTHECRWANLIDVSFPDAVVQATGPWGKRSLVGWYQCLCGQQWAAKVSSLFNWEYRLIQEVRHLRGIVDELVGPDSSSDRWTMDFDEEEEGIKHQEARARELTRLTEDGEARKCRTV